MNDPSIEVRPFDTAHLCEMAQIWLESFRSSGLPYADETTREELERRIPNDIAGGWSVSLAMRGGMLVGFMALKKAEHCLDQLFVKPSAQGQGVGAVLLGLAKKEMPGGFQLRTALANTRAIAFYKRHGLACGARGTHPELGYATQILHWP